MARIVSRPVLPKGQYHAPEPDTEDERKAKEFMHWTHELPCPITGTRQEIVAHHLRVEYDATGRGLTSSKRLGKRPSDWYVVPLHYYVHDQAAGSLHVSGNEPKWWEGFGVCPIIINRGLVDIYNHAPMNERTPMAIALITALGSQRRF